MKIAVCGDIHISRYGSLVKGTDDKYSKRLVNCVKSINWFEQIALENKCDLEVFLGDIFDAPSLDDETITAVKDICWNKIPKKALVGNHESSVLDLKYSALKIFESDNFQVISKPTLENDILYLPYQTELNRTPLIDCLGTENGQAKIIFSHNDIKNIYYGRFLTTEGYDVADLLQYGQLIINGHIHNHSLVRDRIMNLGVLTGLNFCEDALIYPHYIGIVDTDTLKINLIENPYAFNFYKFTISNKKDLEYYLSDSLKPQAVLSIKCQDKVILPENMLLSDLIKLRLKALQDKIAEVRIIGDTVDFDTKEVASPEELSMDYIEEFKKFTLQALGQAPEIEDELNIICG